MPGQVSNIVEANPQLIASASLHVDTPSVGFTDITSNAVSFIDQVQASDGLLLIYHLPSRRTPIPTFNRI